MMEQTQKTIRTVKFPYPLWYHGNLFFLVFFLIVWLPLGMLLALRNTSVTKEASRFYLTYRGKWGWLFFWGIFFFPIAILLLLIKGVDVVEEETLIEHEVVVEKF